MNIYEISHILLKVSKEDLIEFPKYSYSSEALIRLDYETIKILISKHIEIDYANIVLIDTSYYGVPNDIITYEIKFYIKDK